jgi:predicted ArsR family transcriptional regulator
MNQERQLDRLAGLADPVRRALYRHVAGARVAVTREEAATAAGISRSLAAYHLDRLVEDGLLVAGFERRSGRTGPGAGRPAKVYARAPEQLELSLPARDYAAIADLLATALEGEEAGGARAALLAAARRHGQELGAEAAAAGGTTADVLAVLAGRGYEPSWADGAGQGGGTIRLANCPFDRIAASHRDLVCAANLALLEGIAAEAGTDQPLHPTLDPAPGRCCVVLSATNN